MISFLFLICTKRVHNNGVVVVRTHALSPLRTSERILITFDNVYVRLNLLDTFFLSHVCSLQPIFYSRIKSKFIFLILIKAIHLQNTDT